MWVGGAKKIKPTAGGLMGKLQMAARRAAADAAAPATADGFAAATAPPPPPLPLLEKEKEGGVEAKAEELLKEEDPEQQQPQQQWQDQGEEQGEENGEEQRQSSGEEGEQPVGVQKQLAATVAVAGKRLRSAVMKPFVSWAAAETRFDQPEPDSADPVALEDLLAPVDEEEPGPELELEPEPPPPPPPPPDVFSLLRTLSVTAECAVVGAAAGRAAAGGGADPMVAGLRARQRERRLRSQERSLAHAEREHGTLLMVSGHRRAGAEAAERLRRETVRRRAAASELELERTRSLGRPDWPTVYD